MVIHARSSSEMSERAALSERESIAAFEVAEYYSKENIAYGNFDAV